VPFLEVPYKTASHAFQALLSGEVQVTTFSSVVARDHLASGRLRPLATNTLERSSKFPNLPTFKEAGLPLHIPTWFGLFAPVGTPPAVIERLNATLARSFFANPQMVEANAGRGILKEAPAGEAPAVFASFLQQQRGAYADLAKAAGLKQE
jgi:tripartite-type tricarboxylate transporter receptor subunit TctC